MLRPTKQQELQRTGHFIYVFCPLHSLGYV